MWQVKPSVDDPAAASPECSSNTRPAVKIKLFKTPVKEKRCPSPDETRASSIISDEHHFVDQLSDWNLREARESDEELLCCHRRNDPEPIESSVVIPAAVVEDDDDDTESILFGDRMFDENGELIVQDECFSSCDEMEDAEETQNRVDEEEEEGMAPKTVIKRENEVVSPELYVVHENVTRKVGNRVLQTVTDWVEKEALPGSCPSPETWDFIKYGSPVDFASSAETTEALEYQVPFLFLRCGNSPTEVQCINEDEDHATVTLLPRTPSHGPHQRSPEPGYHQEEEEEEVVIETSALSPLSAACESPVPMLDASDNVIFTAANNAPDDVAEFADYSAVQQANACPDEDDDDQFIENDVRSCFGDDHDDDDDNLNVDNMSVSIPADFINREHFREFQEENQDIPAPEISDCSPVCLADTVENVVKTENCDDELQQIAEKSNETPPEIVISSRGSPEVNLEGYISEASVTNEESSNCPIQDAQEQIETSSDQTTSKSSQDEKLVEDTPKSDEELQEMDDGVIENLTMPIRPEEADKDVSEPLLLMLDEEEKEEEEICDQAHPQNVSCDSPIDQVNNSPAAGADSHQKYSSSDEPIVDNPHSDEVPRAIAQRIDTILSPMGANEIDLESEDHSEDEIRVPMPENVLQDPQQELSQNNAVEACTPEPEIPAPIIEDAAENNPEEPSHPQEEGDTVSLTEICTIAQTDNNDFVVTCRKSSDVKLVLSDVGDVVAGVVSLPPAKSRPDKKTITLKTLERITPPVVGEIQIGESSPQSSPGIGIDQPSAEITRPFKKRLWSDKRRRSASSMSSRIYELPSSSDSDSDPVWKPSASAKAAKIRLFSFPDRKRKQEMNSKSFKYYKRRRKPEEIPRYSSDEEPGTPKPLSALLNRMEKPTSWKRFPKSTSSSVLVRLLQLAEYFQFHFQSKNVKIAHSNNIVMAGKVTHRAMKLKQLKLAFQSLQAVMRECESATKYGDASDEPRNQEIHRNFLQALSSSSSPIMSSSVMDLENSLRSIPLEVIRASVCLAARQRPQIQCPTARKSVCFVSPLNDEERKSADILRAAVEKKDMCFTKRVINKGNFSRLAEILFVNRPAVKKPRTSGSLEKIVIKMWETLGEDSKNFPKDFTPPAAEDLLESSGTEPTPPEDCPRFLCLSPSSDSSADAKSMMDVSQEEEEEEDLPEQTNKASKSIFSPESSPSSQNPPEADDDDNGKTDKVVHETAEENKSVQEPSVEASSESWVPDFGPKSPVIVEGHHHQEIDPPTPSYSDAPLASLSSEDRSLPGMESNPSSVASASPSASPRSVKETSPTSEKPAATATPTTVTETPVNTSSPQHHEAISNNSSNPGSSSENPSSSDAQQVKVKETAKKTSFTAVAEEEWRDTMISRSLDPGKCISRRRGSFSDSELLLTKKGKRTLRIVQPLPRENDVIVEPAAAVIETVSSAEVQQPVVVVAEQQPQVIVSENVPAVIDLEAEPDDIPVNAVKPIILTSIEHNNPKLLIENLEHDITVRQLSLEEVTCKALLYLIHRLISLETFLTCPRPPVLFETMIKQLYKSCEVIGTVFRSMKSDRNEPLLQLHLSVCRSRGCQLLPVRIDNSVQCPAFLYVKIAEVVRHMLEAERIGVESWFCELVIKLLAAYFNATSLDLRLEVATQRTLFAGKVGLVMMAKTEQEQLLSLHQHHHPQQQRRSGADILKEAISEIGALSPWVSRSEDCMDAGSPTGGSVRNAAAVGETQQVLDQVPMGESDSGEELGDGNSDHGNPNGHESFNLKKVWRGKFLQQKRVGIPGGVFFPGCETLGQDVAAQECADFAPKPDMFSALVREHFNVPIFQPSARDFASVEDVELHFRKLPVQLQKAIKHSFFTNKPVFMVTCWPDSYMVEFLNIYNLLILGGIPPGPFAFEYLRQSFPRVPTISYPMPAIIDPMPVASVPDQMREYSSGTNAAAARQQQQHQQMPPAAMEMRNNPVHCRMPEAGQLQRTPLPEPFSQHWLNNQEKRITKCSNLITNLADAVSGNVPVLCNPGTSGAPVHQSNIGHRPIDSIKAPQVSIPSAYPQQFVNPVSRHQQVWQPQEGLNCWNSMEQSNASQYAPQNNGFPGFRATSIAPYQMRAAMAQAVAKTTARPRVEGNCPSEPTRGMRHTVMPSSMGPGYPHGGYLPYLPGQGMPNPPGRSPPPYPTSTNVFPNLHPRLQQSMPGTMYSKSQVSSSMGNANPFASSSSSSQHELIRSPVTAAGAGSEAAAVAAAAATRARFRYSSSISATAGDSALGIFPGTHHPGSAGAGVEAASQHQHHHHHQRPVNYNDVAAAAGFVQYATRSTNAEQNLWENQQGFFGFPPNRFGHPRVSMSIPGSVGPRPAAALGIRGPQNGLQGLQPNFPSFAYVTNQESAAHAMRASYYQSTAPIRNQNLSSQPIPMPNETHHQHQPQPGTHPCQPTSSSHHPGPANTHPFRFFPTESVGHGARPGPEHSAQQFCNPNPRRDPGVGSAAGENVPMMHQVPFQISPSAAAASSGRHESRVFEPVVADTVPDFQSHGALGLRQQATGVPVSQTESGMNSLNNTSTFLTCGGSVLSHSAKPAHQQQPQALGNRQMQPTSLPASMTGVGSAPRDLRIPEISAQDPQSAPNARSVSSGLIASPIRTSTHWTSEQENLQALFSGNGDTATSSSSTHDQGSGNPSEEPSPASSATSSQQQQRALCKVCSKPSTCACESCLEVAYCSETCQRRDGVVGKRGTKRKCIHPLSKPQSHGEKAAKTDNPPPPAAAADDSTENDVELLKVVFNNVENLRFETNLVGLVSPKPEVDDENHPKVQQKAATEARRSGGRPRGKKAQQKPVSSRPKKQVRRSTGAEALKEFQEEQEAALLQRLIIDSESRRRMTFHTTALQEHHEPLPLATKAKGKRKAPSSRGRMKRGKPRKGSDPLFTEQDTPSDPLLVCSPADVDDQSFMKSYDFVNLGWRTQWHIPELNFPVAGR